MKRPLCFLCMIFILVSMGCLQLIEVPLPDFSPWDGELVTVTGQVVGKEVRTNAWGETLLVTVMPDEVAVGKAKTADGVKLAEFPDGGGKVLCYLKAGRAGPKLGSRVRIRGELSCFERASNPGQFSAADYYQILKTDYRLYEGEVLAASRSFSRFREGLYRLREMFGRTLNRYFSEENASILRTMLLGEQGQADKEIKELYQRNGIVHILAISGLHISLIGMGVYRLLRRLKMPLPLAVPVAIALMYSYGVMTNMGTSALRAVVMFGMKMLAQLLGRTYDLLTALAVAALLILLGQPLYLRHSGFLFSFLAVLAIGLFIPAMNHSLSIKIDNGAVPASLKPNVMNHSLSIKIPLKVLPRFPAKLTHQLTGMPGQKTFKSFKQLIPHSDRTSVYQPVKPSINQSGQSSAYQSTSLLKERSFQQTKEQPFQQSKQQSIQLFFPLLNKLSTKLSAKLFSKLSSKLSAKQLLQLPAQIIKAFLAGICISAVTLPVYLVFYYQFPPYSVILNLMVIPLMGMVMVAGILIMTVGGLFPPIGEITSVIPTAILIFYEKLCRLGDKLPGSNLILGKPQLWQVVAYVAILVLLILFHRKLRPFIRYFILAAGISLLLLRSPSGLTITFLDVGQGDCIHIKSPEGKNYLIDGGSSSTTAVGTYRILPYLKSRGVKRIDALFITHPDQDHYSAFPELAAVMAADGIPITMLILPDIDGKSKDENYLKLEAIAAEAGITLAYISRGQEILTGELSLKCLHPAPGLAWTEGNAYSTVILLKYHAFTALFTGDIEGPGESDLTAYLAGQEKDTSLTLLKVAHHGSRYSTEADFLRQVSPAYGIISAGGNNAYGHPHKELLARLAKKGTKVYLTYNSGAVTVKTDGKKMTVEEFLQE